MYLATYKSPKYLRDFTHDNLKSSHQALQHSSIKQISVLQVSANT